MYKSVSNSIFSIKGPTGTRGQIFFSNTDTGTILKKGLKKSDCKYILNELENYKDIYQCISISKITIIRTIKVKPNDKCSFKAQRLYPFVIDGRAVQIDYSNIPEGDDTNSWKVHSPNILIKKSIFNEDIVNNLIPYELGVLWMSMVILKKKVIWEPELMIAKLNNEDKYSLFIIDFDKVYSIDKDDNYIANGLPLHNYLTNIFPIPNQDCFNLFIRGIIETSEKLGKYDLGKKILNNITH